MKRLICSLVVAMAAATSIWAGPVDEAKAKALAQRYINNPVKANASTMQRVKANTTAEDKAPALHLFNSQEGEGFVIVAADDRVGGVLGYSDKGRLDTDNMPDGLRALLDSYARTVERVRTDEANVIPVYANRPKASVKPLISAEWSQEYPYNYYTPKSSSGKSTYTGCTITAAAQVLSAHKWPKMRPQGVTKGEGAMAYDYYDWDNMIDNYSNGGYSIAQAQAVGVLMRDLGRLARATYGVNGTLSDEGKVWNALQYYYDCTVRQLEKDLLPGGEFLQVVYNELSLGCPLFMTGGDHAFVYDGYDENGLVHVNWGWGGLDNGYFDINTAATAGGGYNSDGRYYEKQIALLIHPNNGTIEPLKPKPVVLSINNDDGLQFKVSEGLTTSSYIPAQLKGVGARNLAQNEDGAYTGKLGIGLFDKDGTCLHVFGITATQTWSTYYGSYSYDYDWWGIDLSEIDGPGDGTYYLRPLGRRRIDAATDKWGDWTTMVNGNSVPMVVDNGKVTLVQDDNKPHLLLAGKPEILEPAYEYSSQMTGIQLNISNLSRRQARGELKVVLHGTGSLEGETYVVPNAYLMHMVAQRLTTTPWIVKFMTSYTGTNGSFALKAGKYRMTLKFDHNLETKDPAVYDIAVPEDFLIEVLPQNYSERVTVTSVKLLDENGNGVASHHFDLTQMPKVTLGISGYAKYMTQTTCKTQIRYRMVDTATGATVYTSKGYSVSIPRNNETNLTSMTRHTVDLAGMAEGTYEIHVDVERNGAWLDRWNANTLRRKIVLYRKTPSESTKIDETTADPTGQNANRSTAIYGIDGRRLLSIPQRGLYIMNGVKRMAQDR